MADDKPIVLQARPPDNDTQEMVIYGTLYTDVKAFDVEIGYEISIIDGRVNSLLAALDINHCDAIFMRYPSAPYTDRKASEILIDEDIELLTDTVHALREIVRLRWARAWLVDRRGRIRAYARLYGAAQHSVKVRSEQSITLYKEAAKRTEQSNGPIKHPLSRSE